MQTSPLIRGCMWLAAIIALRIVLAFYWSRGCATSCSTSTVSTGLITCFFLQRAMLEFYASVYRPKQSPQVQQQQQVQQEQQEQSQSPSSALPFFSRPIFRGRSALWVRLVLSLALLVTALFALVEGAGEVFQFEVTPSQRRQQHNTASAFSDTNDAAPSSSNANNNKEQSLPPVYRYDGATRFKRVDTNDGQRAEQEVLKAAITNHKQFHSGKSPIEVAHEYQLRGNQQLQQEKHDRMIKARRRLAGIDVPNDNSNSKSGNSKSSQRNDFSPGSIDPYAILISDQPLCELPTSFVSCFLVWFAHCATAILASNLASKQNFRVQRNKRHGQDSSATKRDEDAAQQQDTEDGENDDNRDGDNDDEKETVVVWALETHILVELYQACITCLSCCLLHWAARQWMLDAGSEVPSYVAFITGLSIFHFESQSVVSVVKALTLSLTEQESHLVSALETAMAKHMLTATVSGVRAFKTPLGQLGLVVECEAADSGDENSATTTTAGTSGTATATKVLVEIRALLRTHATWDRFIDKSKITVLLRG